MNSVVHFDLSADDTARAQEFYKKVFGWSFNEVPNINYFMAQTTDTDDKGMPKNPGAINGGLFKREKNDPTTIVIGVDSLDEAIKKVEEAGGKIDIPKKEVGDFGFYARITDTEGNSVGLWESKKK